MDNVAKNLLYRSMDSELNPKEKKMLEEALADSEELRLEKQSIDSLRQNIKGTKETSFNAGFADRVMNTIIDQRSENEQFFDSLLVFFRPIAIAAIVLIIIFAGYNMSSSGQFSVEGALGIPGVTVDDVYDPSLALVTEE